MAKNSHIEWTHHTFNPWWGCKKVSPACDNCYAELWRNEWGINSGDLPHHVDSSAMPIGESP